MSKAIVHFKNYLMRRLIFLILMFILLSSGTHRDASERVISDRIEYIYNLKFFIAERVWKGFGDKKFDLPLIYYTDSVCYVANPTERFITSFKPDLIFQDRELKIYKTYLLDSIPFHMETGVTLGDSSSAYNFKSPFMNCSSFEITRKTIPDVNSTEQWTTMLLHEYFHGFQFKHQNFLSFFEKNVALVPADSLKKIYKSQKWFKESVDKENRILLEVLDEADDKQVRKLIGSFFKLRDERRLQTKQQLNFDIKPIEQTYETMEGTARYVEYELYNHFRKKEPNIKLIKSDSSYQSYQYFRNHNIQNDKWLYLSDKTTYFYATGFNMVRALEKLEVEYKSRLFNEGNLSLEQLLKQY